jgi:DNA-binding transcriptional regulator YdaS (Cro superfamily)
MFGISKSILLTGVIVLIILCISMSLNKESSAASGECLIRDCTAAEKATELTKEKIRQECIPTHVATEALVKKVVQVEHIDLDEIDSQRMINFVLKYHKTDLVADEVRLFFSPRFTTALAGFSFENCAVLQMPMDPDKIDKIVQGEYDEEAE